MKRLIVFASAMAVAAGFQAAPAQPQELLVNGDLESWTGGVPDNWDLTQIDSGGNEGGTPPTITEETTDLRPGTTGSSAMLSVRAASDFTFRYFAHSNSFGPVAEGTNVDFDLWLKGPDLRPFVGVSTDGGATWTVSFAHGSGTNGEIGGHGGAADWTNVTESVADMDVEGNLYRLSLHSFSDNEHLADDLSAMGELAPEPTDVTVGPEGDYDTLSEAVAAVVAAGEHNNGGAVTFQIIGDFTDPGEADLTVFEDDVTISGQVVSKDFHAGRPVIAYAGSGTYIEIPHNEGDQTLEDIILIPEFDADDAARGRPFTIAGNDLNTGNTITLSNVLITASDSANEPVTPDEELPGGQGVTTRWGTSSPFIGFNEEGSDTVYNFDGLVIAHYSHSGSVGAITLYADSGTMNVTNSGFWYNARRGIQVLGASTGGFVINVSDTVIAHQGSAGIETHADADGLVLNIGPGTHIVSGADNGWHGIGFRVPNGVLNIEGTDENPVLITNAGQPGASSSGAGVFFWDASSPPTATFPTLAHARIGGSASQGIAIFGIDLSDGMDINNVIFHGNQAVHATRSGELAFVTGSGTITEGEVNISDVTFFDSQGLGHLLDLDSGNPLTVNVTDTIFAGDGNVNVGTANVTVNISDSALVQHGPHALADPANTGDAAYNVTDTVEYDPHFVSTDPEDEDFLDVQSEGYSDAGSGGEPLGGGANWVGGVVGVMDWMEIVH